MNKFVFDLDGVLRDLAMYLYINCKVPFPERWNWEYKGKNIFDWIKEDNYDALLYAPVTKYFGLIMEYHENKNIPIELWTCQPLNWIKYTKRWVKRNIRRESGVDYKIELKTTEEKEKSLYSEKNLYLIEDSPNFKNYERIILIDRDINRELKVPHRVKSIVELDNKLRRLEKE